MEAIGLNPIRLDRIGLDPVRVNAIRLGVPGASFGSARPYIDPEVLASLKAVVICDGKSNEDSDRAVLRNLVDPDNPFIASNFAWKLNSGFGKYEEDFTTWKTQTGITVTGGKVKVTGKVTNSYLLYHLRSEATNKIKVRVSGLKTPIIYTHYSSSGEEKIMPIRSNGVYVCEASNSVEGDIVTEGFYFSGSDIREGVDFTGLTIEQIPDYEGSLLTDGVDDIITSTKTVQEMLGGSDEVTVLSMTAVPDDSISNHLAVAESNAYNILGSSSFRNEASDSVRGKFGIFGYTGNGVNTVKSVSLINNILGDKNDYKAVSNTISDIQDYYSVTGCLKADNTPKNVKKVAWYWTIIANKVLTADEMNQVIAYFNLDKRVTPDVLYVIKKQGITNENHATFNDKLIDYSGNGHDMQLYNIGWSGWSGIGMYQDIFTTYFEPNAIATREGNYKCHVDATGYLGTMFFTYNQSAKVRRSIPSFKIQLSDLKGGTESIPPSVTYWYIDADGNRTETEPMTANGIYTVPESHIELVDKTQVGFIISPETVATIEELPENGGSLILNGSNSYGRVDNIPVKKDYTVVAERQILGVSSDSDMTLVSDMEDVTDGTLNTFAFEKGAIDAIAVSFDTSTNVTRDNSLKFSYQTKYSYNKQAIIPGGSLGNNKLLLGAGKLHNETVTNFMNAAVNSLMVFPYSMSEFLIERQLKKRKLGTLYPGMIEFRPIVKVSGNISRIRYYMNNWTTEIFPGDYIDKDAVFSIDVYTTSTSAVFNYLKINGKEETFNSQVDSNGYQHLAKSNIVYSKTPMKIEISVDEYVTL